MPKKASRRVDRASNQSLRDWSRTPLALSPRLLDIDCHTLCSTGLVDGVCGDAEAHPPAGVAVRLVSGRTLGRA